MRRETACKRRSQEQPSAACDSTRAQPLSWCRTSRLGMSPMSASAGKPSLDGTHIHFQARLGTGIEACQVAEQLADNGASGECDTHHQGLRALALEPTCSADSQQQFMPHYAKRQPAAGADPGAAAGHLGGVHAAAAEDVVCCVDPPRLQRVHRFCRPRCGVSVRVPTAHAVRLSFTRCCIQGHLVSSGSGPRARQPRRGVPLAYRLLSGLCCRMAAWSEMAKTWGGLLLRAGTHCRSTPPSPTLTCRDAPTTALPPCSCVNAMHHTHSWLVAVDWMLQGLHSSRRRCGCHMTLSL